MMDNISRVTPMILAGGLGTRLQPVISDRPNVMATVSGKVFLTYLLDQLDNAGFWTSEPG